MYTLKNVFKGFPITQRFGENPVVYQKFGLNGHAGIDYGIIEGTEILSPIDGIIGFAGFDETGYGNYIMVWDTNQDLYCLVAHLSKINVQRYQRVKACDLIGLSGNTGNSTGAHCHFECIPTSASGGRMWIENGFKGAIDPLGLDFEYI